jgi:hypothetical protein
MGLNESFPENAMAVTVVGDARKFIVRALPSLRDLKLLKTQMVRSKQKTEFKCYIPVERRKNSFLLLAINLQYMRAFVQLTILFPLLVISLPLFRNGFMLV